MSTNIGKYYDAKNKIINMPDDDYEAPEGGMGVALFNAMKSNLDKVAQIDAATGQTESYSSLLEKCIRTAKGLEKSGIKPGDVVSICSYNQLSCTAPYLAAYFVGAINAALDPTISLEDTKYLIELVKPKIFFVSDNAESLISTALKELNHQAEIIVFGETKENVQFEDYIQEQVGNEDDYKPYYQKNLDELALILFSSGSTNLPKGISQSHRFILYATRVCLFELFFGFASLYWASTTTFGIASVLHGKTRLICKAFDPKLVWEYLDTYPVNLMFIAPCDAIALYRNRPEKHITQLQYFLTGGSSLSNDYLERFQEAMPKTKVVYCYGQSELFWTFNPNHPMLNYKIGCLGLPMNGKSYKIVNPDTEEVLGFHEKGELRIKTKWRMNGYYNQDCSDVYDKDGFLKTGDIFYFDEDFGFYIVDRIKEMFKYKSWHIVPAKIEGKLLGHKDVKYGVVIGVPHPEDDNHAIAFVIPNDDCKSTAEDIAEYVNERVDERHQLRAGVVFVKSLPFTPSQKIKRMALKNMYLRGEIKSIV